MINPTSIMKLRKVYFFWVCRDKASFEWFQDLLIALEEEDISQFLSIRIFLTSKQTKITPEYVQNLAQPTLEDAVTGLRSPTFYGRPNFHKEFAEISDAHECDVGIFYCGPGKAKRDIRNAAKMQNQKRENSRLHFHSGIFLPLNYRELLIHRYSQAE